MTEQEVNSLVEWAKKEQRAREYARTIVEAEKVARSAQRQLNDNYETMEATEWLRKYDEVTKMFQSVTMKIKHFFTMVYGKGNIFCETLKGRDAVDHWYKFCDFAHGNYCNCEINA